MTIPIVEILVIPDYPEYAFAFNYYFSLYFYLMAPLILWRAIVTVLKRG